MPENQDLPSTPVAPLASSPSASSLIHTPAPTKTHVPILVWVLLIIVLLGTGGIGYMVYAQQNTLSGHEVAIKAYQDNLKQWTDQVNVLQSAVQDLRTQVSALPTVMPTLVPDNRDDSEGGFSLGGMTGVLPNDSAPSDQDLRGDDQVMFDDDSLSDGKMTTEDEVGMINSYLNEIKSGQHKAAQPDGIAVYKSRQVSSDGSMTYDIFRSTTEENTFYIYIRQGTNVQPGWFGPFAAFPGS